MFRKNPILLGIAEPCIGAFPIGQGTGISQTTAKKTQDGKQFSESEPARRWQEEVRRLLCRLPLHGREGQQTNRLIPKGMPDPTTMALRHDKKSVELKVDAVLLFNSQSKAHGTLDMPLWGQLFSSLDGGDLNALHLRTKNLSACVESLQKKNAVLARNDISGYRGARRLHFLENRRLWL